MAQRLFGQQTIKKLVQELVDLQTNQSEGITVFFSDSDVTQIQAEIVGPEQTPYEDGVFRIRLSLGSDFPYSPPHGHFITKIFHPNVASNGEICVNVLKKDWKPDTGLRHILLVIRCLLIDPYPESALNEEAGKLMLEDYDQYAKQAKKYTKFYAQSLKQIAMDLQSQENNNKQKEYLVENVVEQQSRLAQAEKKFAKLTTQEIILNNKNTIDPGKRKQISSAQRRGLKRL